MIDFKRLDRADIWIASEPISEDERKRFSEFLKKRREKLAPRKHSVKSRKAVKAKS
jgi:hypothetical protein